MLRRLTVGGRLFGMSGLLMLLTVAVVLVSQRELSRAVEREKASNDEARQTLQLVDLLRSAQVHFKIQVQEWKDVLLRGVEEADFDKHFAAFGEQERVVQEDLKKARALLARRGADTAPVDSMLEKHLELGVNYRTALKAFDRAKLDTHRDVDRRVRGMDRAPNQAMDDAVAAVEKQAREDRERQEQRLEEETARAQTNSAIALVLWFGAAVALSLVFIRSVTGPAGQAAQVARQIAQGNLGVHVEAGGSDELGQMLGSLGVMAESLRKTIGETRACSNTLVTTADEIVGAARRTLQATQQQATAVQETTTSTSELTETVRVTQSRAAEMQLAMDRTVETSEGLRGELSEAQGVLGVTREEMRAIVDAVQGLVTRNQQIGEIIENVREVADQTQLLAVNAGIEAAKAGELGRGFGVVASEMKALADQTKKAAQRIRGIVGEVQRGTAEVVRTAENGREKVQKALTPVEAMMPKVEQLTGQVDESGQALKQILAIVQQQTVGIEQINQAMKVVQAAVQDSLAQTQQLDDNAEGLKVQARQLNDSVVGYRL